MVIASLGLSGLTGCAQDAQEAREQAAFTVEGAQCVTLLAGQTIDAGVVCVTADEDTLYIEYATHDGWELVETHAWIGADLTTMPQTPTGNPRLGNFPYTSGDITGATHHLHAIPIADLGGEPYVCDRLFHAVAHASLRRDDGNGGYQTETGFGEGTPLVTRSSWAMTFPVTLRCDAPPDRLRLSPENSIVLDSCVIGRDRAGRVVGAAAYHASRDRER